MSAGSDVWMNIKDVKNVKDAENLWKTVTFPSCFKENPAQTLSLFFS